jgi:phosphomannomutase
MTRLFGTDGIRGAANVDLRPSLAFALGRATAHEVVWHLYTSDAADD